MGLLPEWMDILPPYDDRIFKLMLTDPDAKKVLKDLISAVLGRKVADVAVRNNELPPQWTEEKAERLDVNCRLDDGTQVDMEMQASPIEEDAAAEGERSRKHLNLKGKSVYYLCDLHSSQSAKGVKRYDRLARTYQVTFSCYSVFPEKPDFLNTFSLRHDKDNELLSDAVHIIFVELSKLRKILKKPVADMTDLEKWAVFLRYAGNPRYRKIVNEVIATKEALQMAGKLLMSISKDERERAMYRSRRMYETDYLSNITTAEDRGRRKGMREGERKGRREGERKGRREGEYWTRVEVAKKLLKRNRPIDEIMEDSGLSRKEIEALRLEQHMEQAMDSERTKEPE